MVAKLRLVLGAVGGFVPPSYHTVITADLTTKSVTKETEPEEGFQSYSVKQSLPLPQDSHSTLSNLASSLLKLPTGEPGCGDLYGTGAKIVALDSQGKVIWENQTPSACVIHDTPDDKLPTSDQIELFENVHNILLSAASSE